MKRFAGLVVFVLLLAPGGIATAEDIIVAEPLLEGTVLNPVDSGDTIIFGDVRATVALIEDGEGGTRIVQLEIVNNLRTALWIEPTYLLGFGEGRYFGDARTDGGAESLTIVSMETEDGRAEVAYEWFMSVKSGGTGLITLEIGSDIENLCYRPFSSNVSGLLDESTTRIHGCWLL